MSAALEQLLSKVISAYCDITFCILNELEKELPDSDGAEELVKLLLTVNFNSVHELKAYRRLVRDKMELQK